MKYILILLTLSLVLLSNVYIIKVAGQTLIGQSLAGDVEWIDPQENVLSLAEHFTRGNFIIEATDFYNSDNDSTVLITVYDSRYRINGEGGTISRVIARPNDSWNVSDKTNTTYINVFIKDLKATKGNIGAYEGLNIVLDERVKIQTRFAGQPTPKLSIFPQGIETNNRTIINRIFTPGSEISINFSIKNDGKATFRNMQFIINRDKNNEKNLPFLFPEENIIRQLPDLKANDTTVINIRFKAPSVNRRINFNISGLVVGNDSFGRTYNASDYIFIIVRPFYEKLIEVQEYVPDKIYMGDFAYVSLYVQNNGFSSMTNINLSEDIPPGFEKLNDFNSTFALKPFERKTFLYRLKPIKPGIYTFPAKSSIVEWEGGLEYNNKSNRLIVNGPYIELKKSGFVEGDNIRINIYAKNSGDMTAIARVRDIVHKDGKEVPILKSLVVRPNSVASFSYTISRTNMTNITSGGKVTFPHADAIVLDQYLYTNERYTQKAISNDLILNVSEKS